MLNDKLGHAMQEVITCPNCGNMTVSEKTAAYSSDKIVSCGKCQLRFSLGVGRTSPSQQIPQPVPQVLPVAMPVVQQPAAPQWRCPYCQSSAGYRTFTQVSTAGWIFFIVFLLLFFPICWIGFFITRKEYRCTTCRMKLQ